MYSNKTAQNCLIRRIQTRAERECHIVFIDLSIYVCELLLLTYKKRARERERKSLVEKVKVVLEIVVVIDRSITGE